MKASARASSRPNRWECRWSPRAHRSLRSWWGGSAALFSGFDYAEAVSELEAILANPSRRETLGEAGRRNALRFEPAALVADFARALDITP